MDLRNGSSERFEKRTKRSCMMTILRRTQRKPLAAPGPTRFRLTATRRRPRSQSVEPLPPITVAERRKELVSRASEFAEPGPAESSRGDTLQLYLREIGQARLHPPNEEIT